MKAHIIGMLAAIPLLAMLTAVPAQAEGAPPSTSSYVSDDTNAVTTTEITYTQYTDDTFKKVVKETKSGPIPLGNADDVWTTGTSQASGCAKVVAENVSKVLLIKVYVYQTWTEWCWTRSTQRVYAVDTGWRLPLVKSGIEWAGEVNHDEGFFDFGEDDGHPISGYEHYRQGHFKIGPLWSPVPWTTHSYPWNDQHVYYNGTAKTWIGK